MTVMQGKANNIIGMDIEFKNNGTIEILMKEYVKECIVTFGEEMNNSVNTSAKHDLFSVFLLKQWSFLCTRLSRSTEEDWVKLRSLLQYLLGTLYMPRIIGENELDLMETYVDASYAVHEDTRGHTGGL